MPLSAGDIEGLRAISQAKDDQINQLRTEGKLKDLTIAALRDFVVQAGITLRCPPDRSTS
jgi:hypothetical protein